MRRGKADHVVFDTYRGVFICQRCGAEYVPAMPVNAHTFSEMPGAFKKQHAGCKERKTPMAKPKTTFGDLQQELARWHDDTFGTTDDPRPCIAHLDEEVHELYEAPFDKTEYADCLILLLNAAGIAGLDAESLLCEAEKKHEVNKTRQWGKPDHSGVIRHNIAFFSREEKRDATNHE